MKSTIVILLFSLVAFTGLFSTDYYKDNLRWDKSGYYVYLPALFINRDLAHLDFYTKPQAGYLHGDTSWNGIIQDPFTHRRYTKYPAGVAVLEFPFFLVAYAYTSITGYPEFYGFSLPFQLAVCIANICWVLVGLLYLRKLLRKYYRDGEIAIVLFLVLFGTNLFCYAVFDCGMSHPFSFGLFCMLLYNTDRWRETGKSKYALILGILLGLIVLTRPTNAIIAIVPLLWSKGAGDKWKDRMQFFKSQLPAMAFAVIPFLGLLLIQFSYWHYITGHWIIYSYKGESFDFSHPHIIDGFTNYNKGWLIYTPLALFFIAGFIPLYRSYRYLFYPVFIFTLLNIYIVFSWGFWAYGWGLSARALIESYALLSLPLAAFVAWCLRLRSPVFKWAIGLVLVFIIALNLFQTYQLKTGILPGNWINKSLYWDLFGRTTPMP